MGELALESDSRSRDSALADAILRHFNSTEANVIWNAEALCEVDRIVDQAVGDIARDLWTTPEALTDNEYAVSECETGSCPDLQVVSESEPSKPLYSSSEISESSSSSSDSATRCSGNDSFEQTSSSSEADWVGNGDDDYSIDGSVDDRTWQEQYQHEGKQYSVCLSNLEQFELEGEIPMLIRAPPNNIFPEGKWILHINRIPRLEGLSPVKTELVRAGRCRGKNLLVISEVLLPYVPWDSPSPEEMSRRWVFDDFAHGIVHSLEEKYDATESYGQYHAPYPRAFGDSVAQHLRWLLDTHAPYPGDHPDVLTCKWSITSPLGRFNTYRVSDTHHLVWDTWHDGPDEVGEFLLPTAWLEGSDFNVALWYTLECSKLARISVLDWPA